MIMLSQILYLYFLAIIFAFFYGDNYGWTLSWIMAIINVLLLYSRNIKIQRYYCRSIAKIRRGIVKLFVRVGFGHFPFASSIRNEILRCTFRLKKGALSNQFTYVSDKNNT